MQRAFARELERRLEARGSAVTVNSFGPGLITRTGFFRYQNPIFVKLFDATNDIFHVAETVDGGLSGVHGGRAGAGAPRGLVLQHGIAPGEGKTGHGAPRVSERRGTTRRRRSCGGTANSSWTRVHRVSGEPSPREYQA